MNNIFLIINLIINFINICFCKNNNLELEYLNKYNNILPNIIKKIIPSVVNIYTKGYKTQNTKNKIKFFVYKNIMKKKYFNSLGSGVIIDSKNGYIITNYHVINNSKIIKIQLYNKDEHDVKIIKYNKDVDLALLKITSSFNNLTEIKISNYKNIRVGDKVIAIGNPFGLGQTVTSGIISALGRCGINSNGIENFIQTDASINKGNSGGALINIYGELIGINTAILSPSGCNIGIGFAIPSEIIKIFIKENNEQLNIKNIGIYGVNINKYINKKYNLNVNTGILVKYVINKSIAYKNGILKNDIILSINNKKIKNFSELKYEIFLSLSYKKDILFKILRNNNIIDIFIIL